MSSFIDSRMRYSTTKDATIYNKKFNSLLKKTLFYLLLEAIPSLSAISFSSSSFSFSVISLNRRNRHTMYEIKINENFNLCLVLFGSLKHVVQHVCIFPNKFESSGNFFCMRFIHKHKSRKITFFTIVNNLGKL